MVLFIIGYCSIARTLEGLSEDGEVRPSLEASLGLMEYLTTVVVQDAAAIMAAEYPGHAVMAYLQEHAGFR